MTGNLIDQVRNIIEVTTAVARGDLVRETTDDAKGRDPRALWSIALTAGAKGRGLRVVGVWCPYLCESEPLASAVSQVTCGEAGAVETERNES